MTTDTEVRIETVTTTARLPRMRTVLGGVIRAQRLMRGWTLRTMSEKCFMALGYLSEVERGEKEPSSETIQAILTAFDLSLTDFLRLAADEALLY